MEDTVLPGALASIVAHQEEIMQMVERAREKDWWDKFAVIGSVFSGIIVAIVGGAFTYFYQASQGAAERLEADRQAEEQRIEAERNMRFDRERIRAAELNAVTGLLPHLSSNNEEIKRTAFLILNTLGSTEITASLARLTPSLGSAEALSVIVNSSQSTDQDRDLAEAALQFLRHGYINTHQVNHLKYLAGDTPFEAELHSNFLEELRNLLGLGLITRRPAKGFRTLERAQMPRDVKDHFEITDMGRRFLAMRSALVADDGVLHG